MTSLFNTEVCDQEDVDVLPLEFELLDRTVEDVSPNARLVMELEQRVVAMEAQLLEEREAAGIELVRVRDEAIAATEAEGFATLEREIAKVRDGIARAIDGFREERSRYFAEIEGETVSLALAIAERILHREVKMDPMLLRAAVHVALQKVAGESKVRLRVPEDQTHGWTELAASQPHDESVVVVGDLHLSAGEVVLETEVGRIELGVASQLKEIERGFFDLLAKRPQ